MKDDRSRYYGHRFPPEIISYAVWVYHRFSLSFRDVEDLNARKLKRRQGRLGDMWHLDEVFIRINGQQQYLWRAVDQDGDVIDILVQPRRDQRAAERFFRRLLRGQGQEPFRIIIDKLRSYSAAVRTILCDVTHNTERYANNRAEVSHQPTRQRERHMRGFNLLAKPNGFSPSTVSSRIVFELDGIC
jgi:putative transposase